MRATMRPPAALLASLLIAALLAGCTSPAPSPDEPGDASEPSYATMGFDGEHWPSLEGHRLVVLDHGAFPAFGTAAAAFENLTGARVEQRSADDTGSALNLLLHERGDPTFDVLYGLDNILLHRAIEAEALEPYEPLLADRVQDEYLFFDPDEVGWPATPVDHGFIAINYDPRHEALGDTNLTLDGLPDHADLFVTQDPRTSTPGLGFVLVTIATYGEDGWQDYWTRLFEGGVLVTAGWSEAYEQHFSAGYGVDFGGLGDKPIVTSYTESPAYEHYFGRPVEDLARVITEPGSTFHQVQTMAIVKGAKNPVAAQAWIEFTLTDAFQELAAPENAVYPVVEGIDVDATYGDVDPEPGTFEPVDLDYRTIGENLEDWVGVWVDLCEAHDCA